MSPEERFEYTAHQIHRGDSIAKLSKLYGVPAKDILKLNRLSSANEVRQGQTVLVPVGLGHKLVSLALVEEPRRRGRHSKRSSEKKIKVSDARNKFHVVRRGETLSAIAARYGTSVRALKVANGLNRLAIQRGQKLHIPES
jgi:LysM repeat protein